MGGEAEQRRPRHLFDSLSSAVIMQRSLRHMAGPVALALGLTASGVCGTQNTNQAKLMSSFETAADIQAVQGHDAEVAAVRRHVTDGVQALQITFHPADWPNVSWQAGAGEAWNWHETPLLVFDAANPEAEPLSFSVRVDDDPSADGSKHCRTASGMLAPHAHGTFALDLSPSADPMQTYGMRGGPPLSSPEKMTSLTGNGALNAGHITAFQIFLNHPQATRTLVIDHLRLLSTVSDADRYRGIVDRFGQYTRADWPGKVHTETELLSRRQAEAKVLAAAPMLPGRDEYGGWADGSALPATGFFTTAKRGGRWWLVTPSGHLFFSLGVDTINLNSATIVQPRDILFTWLPESGDSLAKFYGTTSNVLYGPHKTGKTFDFYQANLQRKYGPDYQQAWRDTTLARLKSWGFNTIGNWSDESLAALKRVPYTATLGVGGAHARVGSGSDYWGKMHDPFDPQFAADCDASFRDKATRLKDDPWCLGYFVDNELSWSGGNVEGGRYGLAYGALAARADQPAKAAFLAQLKAKYDTIEKFNAAWGTNLADWNALQLPFQAPQKPNNAQKSDMGAFVTAFARRYFTVVRGTLKKYDPNHLYLGCRLANYTPEVVQAAGELCDVVSFNIYKPSLDPKEWAFTQGLNKPCLIGEFHFGATDRGMFHPGLGPTANQAARAQAYRTYVGSVLDNPSFVGAHWFQYEDEPLTGRTLDGENYNIGFVSVTDTPYSELVSAARQIHAQAYQRHSQGSAP